MASMQDDNMQQTHVSELILFWYVPFTLVVTWLGGSYLSLIYRKVCTKSRHPIRLALGPAGRTWDLTVLRTFHWVGTEGAS